MYIEWTYALVCRYAKHVRSNVETPIVRTRRVGGRTLAGRRERERESKDGQEGEREGEQGERQGRNRDTRGVTRRKERENDGERPYFSGPCLEHIHVCIHASVRPHPREHKRISPRCICSPVCIRKAHIHIVTWPGSDCPVSYSGFTTLFKTRRRDTVRRDGTENRRRGDGGGEGNG